MASFVVLLIIVAHRFLRLDLLFEPVARLRPAALLLGLLILALCYDVLRLGFRVRLSVHLIIQWALWVWAGITKIVADGTGVVRGLVVGDYLKDVIFLTLIGTLLDSVRKLRALMWLFTAVMTVVALLAIPQRFGPRLCYYYNWQASMALNYEQKTDGRPCLQAGDCYALPPGEQHLASMSWACERTGILGLSTVTERVRYVGSMMDPNSMALALVMGVALALGLATWPRRAGERRRPLLRILLLGCTAIMAGALVLGASRSGQVALALTLLCFLALRIGPAALLLAIPLSIPAAFLTTRKEAELIYSTITRNQTVLNGYQAFLEQPLFGVGLDNYLRISFLNAHNSFMLTATETGVIGSALFLLGIYMAFKLLFLVVRWPRPEIDVDDDTELPPTRIGEEAHEVREVRHLARALLCMLLGVSSCITFQSLSFDVMWLFPVGIVAAFHHIARDTIPDLELNLHPLEVLGALILGGLMPPIIAFLITTLF